MAEHAMGVEVVTPEAALFRGPATLVVASTSEGDFSVMADHAELIGDVVPGVVRIEADGQDPVTILIHGGFVQVTTADGAATGIVEGVGEGDRSTRVAILASIAEPAHEIDKPRAERAKAEAEQMAKKADAWKEYKEAAMIDMMIQTLPKVRRTNFLLGEDDILICFHINLWHCS